MNYARLYDHRFRNVPQGRRNDVWVAVTPLLYKMMNSPERVLDPAAGRGEFINAVPAPERWAVDAIEYAQRPDVTNTRYIVAEIMDAKLPDGHFGGIFVSNFLEHLVSQEAVASFLEKMYACTSPGGRIVIMGPNFRYCAGDYFDFADHTVVLTERSVEEHLYAAGYEIISVCPRFLPYTFTGRLPSHPLLVQAYLRLPLAWRLFGKQFLVVAERPSGEREATAEIQQRDAVFA